MKANLYALGSIALWATLAALGISLSHVPPFLLTGLSLLIGSVIALPLLRHDLRQWCVPISTLALGVYALKRGDRHWSVWVGLVAGGVTVAFWLFFLIGNIVSPA